MATDRCAACGIILSQSENQPESNGICCADCLETYPGLCEMTRDEVVIWLWNNHGPDGNDGHVKAARAWLRIQRKIGRCDESMVLVAARAFGISGSVTVNKLRRWYEVGR